MQQYGLRSIFNIAGQVTALLAVKKVHDPIYKFFFATADSSSRVFVARSMTVEQALRSNQGFQHRLPQ